MKLAVAITLLALVAGAHAVVLPSLDRTIAWKSILRTGSTAGKSTTQFGQIINKAGQPVYETDETGHPTDEPRISHNPDFSSLINTYSYGTYGARKLYMIVQFEAPGPAAQNVVELGQSADGTLTPRSIKSVDWSAWGGLWTPCAGSVTPWTTHLTGEEYEPDARPFSEATDLASLKTKLGGGWQPIADFMSYWNIYPADITYDLVKSKFLPYRYGHIGETKIDYKGTVTTTKWYTLGRAAWEMAYVMPDRKTVYMTDDGTNVGFYKFVATKAGDLSAGTLYAAKMTQTSASDGGAFTISWIELGTGNQKDLRKFGDNTTFSDIFETASWTDGAGCPSGFTSVNEGGRAVQCLKLKPGMEVRAAFLETRRYAGVKGATTEFSKWEGITYDSKRNQLLTSMSAIRYGMEDNAKNGVASTQYDKGGNNDVKLPYNPCGCVYKLQLDASLSATSMAGLFCGVKYVCPDPTDPESCDTDNICDVNNIASPDNLSYMPEFDTLLVGEDTAEHQNDVLFAYNLTSGNLDRIFSTPYGAEVTSTYWYNNIGGSSYIMAVIQHPYAESDQDRVTDPESTGVEAWVGYFTWKTVPKTSGLKFQPIDPSVTNEEKHVPRWSTKVTLYRGGDRAVTPLQRKAGGAMRRRWI